MEIAAYVEEAAEALNLPKELPGSNEDHLL